MKEDSKNKLNFRQLMMTILASLVLAFLSFVLTFMISFYICCKISPPYSIDPDTGEKQMVMAMGQMFLSLIISFIVSLIVLVVSSKRLRKMFLSE